MKYNELNKSSEYHGLNGPAVGAQKNVKHCYHTLHTSYKYMFHSVPLHV